jgi:multiple sugar transport system substrate-binding protein
VEITFWNNLGNTHPESIARKSLIEEYIQQHPDEITVPLEEFDQAVSLDKVTAAAAGGVPPNIMFLAWYDTTGLFVKGATADVDEELKAYKDWGQQRADIFPAFLESAVWKGKMHQMPVYTNNIAMIYNPRLLAEAGLQPPRKDWTWNDFLDYAGKVARPPDRYALDLGWSISYWQIWYGTAGGRLFSKDGTKVQANTPQAVEATQFLLGLVNRGYAPPESSGEIFTQRKTVFEHQGPYRIPTLRQRGDDFEVTTSPLHPVRKEIFAPNGGHSLVIFNVQDRARQRTAGAIAKWFNTAHPQAVLCIRATSIPISKQALESKELRDYMATDKDHAAFIEQAPYGYRGVAMPSWTEFTKVVNTGVADMLGGKISINDGLARMEREAQQLLDADLTLGG